MSNLDLVFRLVTKFFLNCARTYPAMFFVSPSDSVFRFTMVYIAKLRVQFSELFPHLTNVDGASDVISHFLISFQVICVIRLELKFNFKKFQLKETPICNEDP